MSPVGDHFPASVGVDTLDAGHDNKSAPSSAPTPPGPRRPIGHDRLMDTVPPRSDTPPATCPTCGAPGDGHLRTDRGVTVATYLCAAGHGWMTKWLHVSDGAA